jgi:membrane-bound hydrogenase subunit beta
MTETVKDKLITKFGLSADAIRVQRERRIFMTIEYAQFRKVFEYAKNELEFKMLLSITGFDEGENLAFMYHMGNERGVVLNIKTSVPKNDPKVQTVTDLFPGADVMERELVDLFGADVKGLVPGSRYPLTDDWPANNFPLRKDWQGLEKMECENK